MEIKIKNGKNVLVKVDETDIVDGVLRIPDGVEVITHFLMPNVRKVDDGQYDFIWVKKVLKMK